MRGAKKVHRIAFSFEVKKKEEEEATKQNVKEIKICQNKSEI